MLCCRMRPLCRDPGSWALNDLRTIGVEDTGAQAVLRVCQNEVGGAALGLEQ